MELIEKENLNGGESLENPKRPTAEDITLSKIPATN